MSSWLCVAGRVVAIVVPALLLGVLATDARAQCDSVSCPLGCCADSLCVEPTANECGFAGSACIDCGPSADSCVVGQCQCGGGPSCGAGQECVGGTCVCTAASCPTGCCAGTSCTVPSVSQCGTSGETCTDCGSFADACLSGVCRCGSGPACVSGQSCVAGACVCTAGSCPSGCCDGNTCATPSTSQCGTGGGICVDCGLGADACISGVCECGGGPMCVPGESCVGGTCVAPTPIPAFSGGRWLILGTLTLCVAGWIGVHRLGRGSTR